ncbi:MAG: hypothetical protein AB8B68_01150 [Rickettsiaceae bacterium]
MIRLKFLNNIDIMIYALIILILLIIIITKTIRDKHKKNRTSIQLYLELKFLHKNINDSVTNTTSPNFTIELMESIKDYYCLEEIMIFDSIKMEFKTSRPKVLKKEIRNYVQENLTIILEKLQTQEYVTNTIKINAKEYLIYIFEIAPSSFIVCVEDSPSLLGKHELLDLTTNISLLKMRLLH